MASREAKYLRKLLSIIGTAGHAVQAVAGGETEPPFSYTVGLTKQDKPELLIVGVPPHSAATILNDLAPRTLVAGETIDDVANLPFRVVAIDDVRAAQMFLCTDIYNGADVTGLQIVYPDKAGRFPWDEGYDLDPRVQPVYGTP